MAFLYKLYRRRRTNSWYKKCQSTCLRNSKLRLWIPIKLYFKILMMFRVGWFDIKCMKKCTWIKFYHVWTCVCDWWDELCSTNVCACDLLFHSKSVWFTRLSSLWFSLFFLNSLIMIYQIHTFWTVIFVVFCLTLAWLESPSFSLTFAFHIHVYLIHLLATFGLLSISTATRQTNSKRAIILKM